MNGRFIGQPVRLTALRLIMPVCLLLSAKEGLPEEPKQTPAAALVARPGPLVIAHRGDCQRAPENTLPAFRLALEARADLVELDYYHSRDGVPVVLHDATLERTTDAVARWGSNRLAVSSRSAAELAGLDAGRWFGAAFAGTRLPTLQQALEAIQPASTTLIERKGGDPATLLRLLRQGGWLDRVVVQSFHWPFLREARALAPELVLGALGPPAQWEGRKLVDAEKALSERFINEIVRLGAQLVVWNRQVSAESVRLAQQRGLKVWVYTINDPQEAAHLVALGVNGIITDQPAQIRAVLK